MQRLHLLPALLAVFLLTGCRRRSAPPSLSSFRKMAHPIPWETVPSAPEPFSTDIEKAEDVVFRFRLSRNPAAREAAGFLACMG